MKNHFVQCDRVLWDSLPWDDGEAERPWMSTSSTRFAQLRFRIQAEAGQCCMVQMDHRHH